MDIVNKLHYVLSDGHYDLDYVVEQNLLISTMSRGELLDVMTVPGELNGEYKFTQETVDQYIAQGLGAAFPVLVPELQTVVYSAGELQRSGVSAERYAELLAQYPKLNRAMKSGIPDSSRPTEIVLSLLAVDSFSAEGTKIASERQIDYTQEAWLSPDKVPVTDVRTVLDEAQVNLITGTFSLKVAKNDG